MKKNVTCSSVPQLFLSIDINNRGFMCIRIFSRSRWRKSYLITIYVYSGCFLFYLWSCMFYMLLSTCRLVSLDSIALIARELNANLIIWVMDFMHVAKKSFVLSAKSLNGREESFTGHFPSCAFHCSSRSGKKFLLLHRLSLLINNSSRSKEVQRCTKKTFLFNDCEWN